MGKRRFDANATIATLLIRAQNASDGGKGRSVFVGSEKAAQDNAAGYVVKDSCIREAIKLIQEHNTVFRLYITKDWGYNARYIVTFATSLEGCPLWVTFHCNMGELCPNCKKRPKHGDLIPSREAAACIYRHFCPLGGYCVLN